MPEMPGIYFISPTVESIQRLCKDFKTEIQYQSAHVFFSSNVREFFLYLLRFAVCAAPPPPLPSYLVLLVEGWPYPVW